MDVMSNDILQFAALVAAYVGVSKGFGLSDKYAPLVSLLIAAIFVLVPEFIQTKLTLISVVGLTAAGAYHFTKPRKEDGGDGL